MFWKTFITCVTLEVAIFISDIAILVRNESRVPLDYKFYQNQFLVSEDFRFHSVLQKFAIHLNRHLMLSLEQWGICVILFHQVRIWWGWELIEGLHYCFHNIEKYNASFQSWIWRHLRDSPISLGALAFSVWKTSKYDTIGLIWSNMDQISSRSLCW